MKTLRVDYSLKSRFYHLVVIGLLLGTFIGLWVLRGHPSIIGLAVVVYTYFILIEAGPIEMSENVVARKHLFGTHEMRWDEVQLVEMQPSNDKLIVLRGANKSLVIPGTDIWAGEDKEAMTQLFFDQIAARQIPFERTLVGGAHHSKNTKVR